MRRRRDDRRGVAAVLYVAALAMAVLGVLAFSQVYTENTTMLVARSVAWRRAAYAADSALAEAYGSVVARLNRTGDPEFTRMRTCPRSAGWSASVKPEVSRKALGSDVQLDDVTVRITRLKLYSGIPSAPEADRFGLLVLTARARAQVYGSRAWVERETTWVHEIKQSPAIPPSPFHKLPVYIHDFDYLRRKIDEYHQATDHVDQTAASLSRRTAAQLQHLVARLEQTQQVVKTHVGKNPPDAGNPRWQEVIQAAPRQRVWSGLGLADGTFPLPPPRWPRFPDVPGGQVADGPVYFVSDQNGSLHRGDVALELPSAPDLESVPHPFPGLPSVNGVVEASLLDWPGTADGISHDGRMHYPRPADPAGFQTIIGPHRDYQARERRLMEDGRKQYADVLLPYGKRLRFVPSEHRRRLEAEYWPSAGADLARRRAAFVYPDRATFARVHGPGVLVLYGVEFVDGSDGIDLADRSQVQGPGTLAAKGRIRAGPLGREGDDPVTLLSGTGISVFDRVQASLIAPTGTISFGGTQVQGVVAVGGLDPRSCGEFELTPDAKLGTLDPATRGDGLVINVSPATKLVLGRRL